MNKTDRLHHITPCYMRLFYQAFPIRDALRHELSWTHYRLLSTLEREDEAFKP